MDKSTKSKINRRDFLKFAPTLGAVGIGLGLGTKSLANVCINTPAQTAGPFYPGEREFSSLTDLTQLEGHSERAEGQIIYIKGRVLDAQCQPLTNANVEIWQACATGKYNNPRDPNPAPLDEHFRYWAETFTNDKGEYFFKSILPGAYPADTDWTRPPHIHFRISKLGYSELITQMYFKGDQLNDSDLILKQIPQTERNSVIIEFTPSENGLEEKSLTGNFDITLQKVRR